MLPATHRLKTKKPRKRSKRTLGFVEHLALVGWATITTLLAVIALANAYPLEGTEAMGSQMNALVWYWVLATALAGCVSAIARRRRLAYFWKNSSKPLVAFQFLGALVFGVVNGTLISFFMHVTEVKNSLPTIFSSYSQVKDQVPTPFLEDGGINLEWFDENQALRTDKKAAWCERAQTTHRFFLGAHTGGSHSNQVIAFVLGNSLLRSLKDHGCISDQQWLDQMTLAYEQARLLPGPDLFIQKKMAWIPFYKMLYGAPEIMVKRIKPTPNNVCAQMASDSLAFKSSAEFCAAFFSSEKLATLEDLERIRNALGARADKEKDTHEPSNPRSQWRQAVYDDL